MSLKADRKVCKRVSGSRHGDRKGAFRGTRWARQSLYFADWYASCLFRLASLANLCLFLLRFGVCQQQHGLLFGCFSAAFGSPWQHRTTRFCTADARHLGPLCTECCFVPALSRHNPHPCPRSPKIPRLRIHATCSLIILFYDVPHLSALLQPRFRVNRSSPVSLQFP